MKKIALSGWCLLFSIFALSAQSSVSTLQRTDSIVLEGYRGYPMAQKDGFSFFDAEKGAFEKYDFSGALKERIVADSVYRESKDFKSGNRHFAFGYTWQIGDQQVILSNLQGSYKLHFLDKSGKLQYTKTLTPKFKGDKYYVGLRDFTPRAIANEKKHTIFLPVEKVSTKNYPDDDQGFRAYYREKFKTPGLVGVFSLEGEMIDVFGEYDAFYRQEKLFPDFHRCQIGQAGEDSILISFPLADQVSIYHNGIQKTSIGAHGAHFNKTPDQYAVAQTRMEYRDANPKYYIETPMYSDCKIVERRYLIRSYAIAIKDTVQFSPAEIAKKEKWLRGEIKGCLLPTKHDAQQAEQLKYKPCFVQIFDLKAPATPIYDGPIDLRYPIFLGMRGEEEFLFISSYRPEEGEDQVVYAYRLTKGRMDR